MRIPFWMSKDFKAEQNMARMRTEIALAEMPPPEPPPELPPWLFDNPIVQGYKNIGEWGTETVTSEPTMKERVQAEVLEGTEAQPQEVPRWQAMLREIEPLDYMPMYGGTKKVIKGAGKLAKETIEGKLAKPLPGQAELPKVEAPAPKALEAPTAPLEPPKPGGEVPPIPPEKPPTATGDTQPIKNAIDELVTSLKKGKSLQRVTRAMQSEERSKRASVAIGYMQDPNLSTAEAFQKAKEAYTGKLPRPELTPPPISGAAQSTLRDAIRNTPAIPQNFVYTRTTADGALQKIFQGELPTKGEIELLEEIFGSELGGVLRGLKPLQEKIIENALDALNLPRSVKSAYDVSAPLRQGLWLWGRHPIKSLSATKDMFKAFASERFGQSLDDFYRGNIAKELAPDASWVKSQEHGLYYAPYQRGQGALSQREESFMSRFADKIPGVRLSERAYVTYLNKIRQDTWKYYSDRLTKQGAEKWEFDELAKFINVATGRGDLGKFSTISPQLSTILFSPRMQAATVELPLMLASKSPAIRRIAAENIGSTLAAGVGLLTLASLGGATVELDPRSADFAKIKVGDTRLDIWGGKLQYNVLLARLLTRKTKAQSGEMYELGADSFAGDILGLLTHFVRGKLAPTPGLITDLLVGSDFLGQPMTTERIPGIAANALAPMSAQSTVEAIQQDKGVGAALSVPGYLGVGVSSYGKPKDRREQLLEQLQKKMEKIKGSENRKAQIRADLERKLRR